MMLEGELRRLIEYLTATYSKYSSVMTTRNPHVELSQSSTLQPSYKIVYHEGLSYPTYNPQAAVHGNRGTKHGS